MVDVARGFEYEPLRQTVRIEPGQRDLTLQIGRIADMASEGWWSGDSHVHFLSTPGAQADHLAWLERPFAEALRALEERGRR